MSYYLIDYENTKFDGLTGIEELTDQDNVCLFYSRNANTLTFELHRKINASRANLLFQEVEVGLRNALDFQLVTFLGYLIAKDPANDYFIITNDKGFRSVCNYWTSRNASVRIGKDLTIRPRRPRQVEEAAEEEIPEAARVIEAEDAPVESAAPAEQVSRAEPAEPAESAEPAEEKAPEKAASEAGPEDREEEKYGRGRNSRRRRGGRREDRDRQGRRDRSDSRRHDSEAAPAEAAPAEEAEEKKAPKKREMHFFGFSADELAALKGEKAAEQAEETQPAQVSEEEVSYQEEAPAAEVPAAEAEEEGAPAEAAPVQEMAEETPAPEEEAAAQEAAAEEAAAQAPAEEKTEEQKPKRRRRRSSRGKKSDAAKGEAPKDTKVQETEAQQAEAPAEEAEKKAPARKTRKQPTKEEQRRLTAERQKVRAELLEKVKEVISEETDASKVTSIICRYKTKSGINNAIVREFPSPDNHKASEYYKAIKNLIKDKKGR